MTSPGRYIKANVIRSNNLPSTRGNAVKLPKLLDDEEKREQWLQQMHDPSVPKIIDLFCGAGGMSEGFINAGFVVAAALDHDRDACDTFAANMAARVFCTEIAQIDNPGFMLEGLENISIDVIVGGPPCQGFSIGGRARIRSLEEAAREILLARNELYQQYFRFVEKFQPNFFVMENVPQLVSFESGAYIKGIQQECERLGYAWDYKIIDAADYGVPQVRRRLIIIGSKNGRLFRWPRILPKEHIVTLKAAIDDLPKVLPPALEECLPYSQEIPGSIYQQLMRSRVPVNQRDKIYDHIVRPVREDDKHIFTHMKPGDRYLDIDEKYRRYNAESFKDKYYMLKPDVPSVTITAHLAKDGYRYIHWDIEQYRTISVREAARIQSFGDHFRFSGSRSARFRQIGNAVPPLLAEALAEQIFRAIKRSKEGVFDEPVQLGLPGYEHWSSLAGLAE